MEKHGKTKREGSDDTKIEKRIKKMTYQKLMCDGFELNYCIKGQGQPILVVGSSVYYPRLFSEDFYQHFQVIF